MSISNINNISIRKLTSRLIMITVNSIKESGQVYTFPIEDTVIKFKLNFNTNKYMFEKA